MMNVGNALKLTCIGFAGGILLRVISLLFFYDYNTGFYLDDGISMFGSVGIILLCSVIAFIMCIKDKRPIGSGPPQGNKASACACLISGVALCGSSAYQIYKRIENPNQYTETVSGFAEMQSHVIHIALIAISALFGLVQIYVSISVFRGRGYIKGFPILYLTGVIWGMVYLILVFIYYGKSASILENAYTVLGGAMLLLSLFYISKNISNIGGAATTKRMYIVGAPAAMLLLTYTISNLILKFMRRDYDMLQEIPIEIQISVLFVTIFVFVFLFTYQQRTLSRNKTLQQVTVNTHAHAHRPSTIKTMGETQIMVENHTAKDDKNTELGKTTSEERAGEDRIKVEAPDLVEDRGINQIIDEKNEKMRQTIELGNSSKSRTTSEKLSEIKTLATKPGEHARVKHFKSEKESKSKNRANKKGRRFK